MRASQACLTSPAAGNWASLETWVFRTRHPVSTGIRQPTPWWACSIVSFVSHHYSFLLLKLKRGTVYLLMSHLSRHYQFSISRIDWKLTYFTAAIAFCDISETWPSCSSPQYSGPCNSLGHCKKLWWCWWWWWYFRMGSFSVDQRWSLMYISQMCIQVWPKARKTSSRFFNLKRINYNFNVVIIWPTLC